MLTLVKFLVTMSVIGGLVFAGLFALATFVTPKPHDISVPVAADKMNREPH